MAKNKILIVEDDRIISMVLERTLSRNGYEVVDKVDKGEDAISSYKEYKPDLILMDIQLKEGIDGITTINKIREFSDVPVIYITGNSDAHSKQRAKETQYIDYMVKPIQNNRLLKSIQEALG